MNQFVQINETLYNLDAIKRISIDVDVLSGNLDNLSLHIFLTFDFSMDRSKLEQISLFSESINFEILLAKKYEKYNKLVRQAYNKLGHINPFSSYAHNKFISKTNKLNVVGIFLRMVLDTINNVKNANFNRFVELLNAEGYNKDAVSPHALEQNKEVQTIVWNREAYVEIVKELDEFVTELKIDLESKADEFVLKNEGKYDDDKDE